MTDSKNANTSDDHAKGTRQGREEDVESSVSRLEHAVQELVSVAKEEFSDRAGAFLEETTEKLRRELSSRNERDQPGASSNYQSKRSGRSARRDAKYARRKARFARRAERQDSPANRGRELARDPENEKICGVCAGLANYWQMETWVVRCIAVTGLIFMPQIVIPAYFIACIVMKKKKSKKVDDTSSILGRDHSNIAPEFGPVLSPRNSLRNIQAELDQAELRLRRMETHVTSGQYELQMELNKIDNEQGV